MTRSSPRAVFADGEGRIFDHPELLMVAWDGAGFRVPHPDELVPLPLGSDLFVLPERTPLALDPDTGDLVEVDELAEIGAVRAVSAFVAPAWLRLLHPAYQRLDGAPDLTLYAYSAIGWMNGRFYVPAVRVDADQRQDPYRFDYDEVAARVRARRAQLPTNASIRHLENCALVYQCRAAQNYFLDRWEAPMPASTGCNAGCLGCISEQPANAVKPPHERIEFAAHAADLVEVAVGHLERVTNGVVSFGQGCEGEPLLRPKVLLATVAGIRARTANGVVNLNSNGSMPDTVAALADAGLDALRISINSARPDAYAAYYRPRGYDLDDVLRSAKEMSQRGRYVSLNWLIFPGVSDTPADLEAMEAFIEAGGVDLIQLRNLNIDPQLYLRELGEDAVDRPIGLIAAIHRLRARFPRLRFGYFNPPRTRMGRVGPLPGARLGLPAATLKGLAEPRPAYL